MTYINSKLLLKQKGTLVITNKIDKNGNLIVKVDPITNENGNLVLKVEPLTLTDKQQQYKKSIQKIKERPYDYFKISHELQNDPGIIAQAFPDPL